MSFSNCIQDLLKALENAKKRVPMSQEDMEILRNYEFDLDLHLLELEFGQEIAMSKRLGISKNMFPPEPELDDDEVKAVVLKILEVWALFNYYAEFPHGLRLRKAYTALVKMWDDEVMSCIIGNFHFDFYNEEMIRHVDPDANPETTYQSANPINRNDLPF